jgi:hypothetical protein
MTQLALIRLPIGRTPDITARKHRGNAQSIQAHESIEPVKSSIRESVFDLIRKSGTKGMTAAEIADCGIPYQTASGRISELKAVGRVVNSGRTRPTSRCRAAVVVASEYA